MCFIVFYHACPQPRVPSTNESLDFSHRKYLSQIINMHSLQYYIPVSSHGMTRHRGQEYLWEFAYNLCELIHNLSLSKITSYNVRSTTFSFISLTSNKICTTCLSNKPLIDLFTQLLRLFCNRPLALTGHVTNASFKQ